ncbi:MAG: hypothetical protein HYU41_28640 [Candidatus Rokubacteria bacterium]|nr:hypothetical protein [Candidatus Rokubacteria bacterium]
MDGDAVGKREHHGPYRRQPQHGLRFPEGIDGARRRNRGQERPHEERGDRPEQRQLTKLATATGEGDDERADREYGERDPRERDRGRQPERQRDEGRAAQRRGAQ